MPVNPCTTVLPVFGIVAFSASEFLALYPEFTGINNANPSALLNNFNSATLLLNNSCCSRVKDANQRLLLLYMLVAHLTTIYQGINDAGLGSPMFTGSASIAGTLLTISAAVFGTVAIGSILTDLTGLIIPGTTITALGTGTGGLGTYTVNATQTLTTEGILVAGVPNIQPPLGIVGRVSDATEGAVSVSAELNTAPLTNPGQAYYSQTKYGFQFWQATARFRTALFLPAPPGGTPIYGPYDTNGNWPGRF